jgi:hypothetical protein
MEDLNLDTLIANIQSTDDTVRAAARDGAGPVGAKAMTPLARLAVGAEDLEVARAAGRAMQNIVYYAGRPGAADEAKAVAAELIKLLNVKQPQFRRNVLWMTWQIAGDEATDPVASLLDDAEVGEDARMCLERLPGDKATAALRARLAAAPAAEKPALAHSLGVRGVEAPGVPDLRLVPTKTTSVKPVGR